MSRPVRYEDEMPGGAATDVAEPEGHDSWLAHFRHACETDPALFGMVRKYIEDMEAQHGGGEEDAMEGGADEMPEPGGEEEPVPDQYSMVGRAGDYIRDKVRGAVNSETAKKLRNNRTLRHAARGAAVGAVGGAAANAAREGTIGSAIRGGAGGAFVGGAAGAAHAGLRRGPRQDEDEGMMSPSGAEGARDARRRMTSSDGPHYGPATTKTGTGVAGESAEARGVDLKNKTISQYAQDQVPVAYQAALQYMENRLSSVEAFAVEKDREIARLQAVNARKDSELIVYQLQLEGFKAIADPRDAETLTRHLASLNTNDRQAKVQEIVACWERDSSLAYAAQGAPTGDFLPVSREQAESRQATTFDDSKLDVALRYMRANPGKAWEECQAYAMNGHAVQY